MDSSASSVVPELSGEINSLNSLAAEAKPVEKEVVSSEQPSDLFNQNETFFTIPKSVSEENNPKYSQEHPVVDKITVSSECDTIEDVNSTDSSQNQETVNLYTQDIIDTVEKVVNAVDENLTSIKPVADTILPYNLEKEFFSKDYVATDPNIIVERQDSASLETESIIVNTVSTCKLTDIIKHNVSIPPVTKLVEMKVTPIIEPIDTLPLTKPINLDIADDIMNICATDVTNVCTADAANVCTAVAEPNAIEAVTTNIVTISNVKSLNVEIIPELAIVDPAPAATESNVNIDPIVESIDSNIISESITIDTIATEPIIVDTSATETFVVDTIATKPGVVNTTFIDSNASHATIQEPITSCSTHTACDSTITEPITNDDTVAELIADNTTFISEPITGDTIVAESIMGDTIATESIMVDTIATGSIIIDAIATETSLVGTTIKEPITSVSTVTKSIASGITIIEPVGNDNTVVECSTENITVIKPVFVTSKSTIVDAVEPMVVDAVEPMVVDAVEPMVVDTIESIVSNIEQIGDGAIITNEMNDSNLVASTESTAVDSTECIAVDAVINTAESVAIEPMIVDAVQPVVINTTESASVEPMIVDTVEPVVLNAVEPTVSNTITESIIDEPDITIGFPPENIFEYMWPSEKGEFYILQEQISDYLCIKSFKRKYPDLFRRPVEIAEKLFLKEKGVVTETQCDLGLTALKSDDVMELMNKDYSEKYAEYIKILREKERKTVSEKHKEYASSVDKNKIADVAKKAIKSAAEYNAHLNHERKEERCCCFDLQTFTIHYPTGRRKKNDGPKMGKYPVALLPGQYQDSYKKYTPQELKYLPLSTVVYGPLQEIKSAIQSDGSDSEDSTGSDGSCSSSQGTHDDNSGESSSGSEKNDKSSISNTTTTPTVEKITVRHIVTNKAKPISICKVCKLPSGSGKEEKNEMLLQCSVCRSNGHPTCLGLTLTMVAVLKTYPWQCMDCKTCVHCQDPYDEDKMLFCDICDRGYHTFCVGLKVLPPGKWICPMCGHCSICNATKPGPENSKAQWQYDCATFTDTNRLQRLVCQTCSKRKR